ncbi:hypothetical protein [Larsenimonas suaedae]|uniref:Phosphate ABC transporter substrate-binding protein n=1 Tax=Larsenimonas suaedae TaxID=1851019 RepID=A0ABU1GRD3_9GAMM|nr:hypothetical protein [Larsenimonas suaedae]MCM2972616.1 hypothetical protein [Larsenimonas suaedae]MDR5894588.1 hypothetical protein [Larsenimonas suaedae]
MRWLRTLLMALLLTLTPAIASANLVVVVSNDSQVQSLTYDDVVNIFMGRLSTLPGGEPVVPVDYMPLRASFYKALVNRELADINAWWARLVFSGRGSPPRKSDGFDETIELISHNPGVLGYLDKSRVDPRVRVVYEFGGRS